MKRYIYRCIPQIINWIKECPVLTKNEHSSEITQFLYIQYTPSALIRLFIKEIVPLNEMLLLDEFPWDSKPTKDLWDTILKPAFIVLSKMKKQEVNQVILKCIEENKIVAAIALLNHLVK